MVGKREFMEVARAWRRKRRGSSTAKDADRTGSYEHERFDFLGPDRVLPSAYGLTAACISVPMSE